MYVCIHVRMYVSTYMYLCMPVYARMYVSLPVYVPVCTRM